MRLLTLLLALSAVFSTRLPAQGQVTGAAAGGTASDVICVIVDGRLAEVAAQYDPESRETRVGSRPLADVYPSATSPYLAGTDWYVADEMVHFERRRYVRYGRPRILRPAVLTPVGEFRGIPLFAESRRDAFRFVYALVNPGCEFQPYWYAATVGAVRGE